MAQGCLLYECMQLYRGIVDTPACRLSGNTAERLEQSACCVEYLLGYVCCVCVCVMLQQDSSITYSQSGLRQQP